MSPEKQKALELEVFVALNQRYAQKRGAGQGQFMTAETHDLAAFIAGVVAKAMRGGHERPANNKVRPT